MNDIQYGDIATIVFLSIIGLAYAVSAGVCGFMLTWRFLRDWQAGANTYGYVQSPAYAAFGVVLMITAWLAFRGVNGMFQQIAGVVA
jgi:hypothetical protein